MVVFTCNHCGDSLQKPRVEKHYSMQCRKPKSLTCVDCFKDFKDEEYVVHTKCVTEEERYSAKGSIPTGIVKKGDAKQESWTDMIRSIVDNEENMIASLKSLFHTISTYTNVPRKKHKFTNFLKNCLGSRVNFNDVEAAWNLIEKYKSDQSKSNAQVASSNGQAKTEIVEKVKKHKLDGNDEIPAKKKKSKVDNELKDEENEVENGTDSTQNGETKKKKKKSKENSSDINEEEKGKKHKLNGNDEVPAKKKKLNVNGNEVKSEQYEAKENNTLNCQSDGETKKKKKKSKDSLTEDKEQEKDKAKENPEVFSYKNTILTILKDKGSTSIKKLQKKVLKKYVEETGNECTEKIIKKFNHKLKKLPNVTINDDIVNLTS